MQRTVVHYIADAQRETLTYDAIVYCQRLYVLIESLSSLPVARPSHPVDSSSSSSSSSAAAAVCHALTSTVHVLRAPQLRYVPAAQPPPGNSTTLLSVSQLISKILKLKIVINCVFDKSVASSDTVMSGGRF